MPEAEAHGMTAHRSADVGNNLPARLEVPSDSFHGFTRATQYPIRCLIPDLPAASELQPWLEQIDQNRWYSNFGPLLLEYESRLTELTGAAAHGGLCVTTSSGTAALELALSAMALPSRSRVLLPAFTFPATALAVLRCGLTPVFCDVCPDTWTLTPAIARAALRRVDDAALVIPVATFGWPLPVQLWDEFSASQGIPVLIDAAPALGAQMVGAKTSAIFSLHATKPLGVGEGGAFATADPDFAERVRRLSNFGFHQGQIASAGTNAKLSEYAAAVGLAQLQRWPVLRVRREVLWRSFREKLGSIDGVRMQAECSGAPAMLAVHIPRIGAAIGEALSRRGIETRRWYLPALHRHPVFARCRTIGGEGNPAPVVTEELERGVVGLPFHTRLSEDDVVRTTDALAAAVKEHATAGPRAP